ncbi:MAG TPA: NAD-dependent succinate-semialdehyde dehydrogenase [Nitrososphaerales archaeon]|nr:NAD-dependent succinate-semialdehyde dehydrogenase [Nitrososphaerales archaeon]
MQKTTVIETVNPATDEKTADYPLFSDEQVNRVARSANQAFASWRKLSIEERGDYLRKLASALRSKKKAFSRIMTIEMGKPITQSEAEVEKCAWTAEVYADNASSWLAEEIVKTDANLSYVEFDPLGVVLSVMPWNFPFWQALRFAIPTLVAGNTTILRHSNVCPGSALAIEEAFKSAGFPEGVFTTIITDHGAVSKLIQSDHIAGVSLTGSTEAGRAIGEEAARNFKKFVLELGGSDPFMVLEDADVREAARVGAEGRLINSGQSCIASKRFIVVKSVAQEFTEGFVSAFEKKITGDPLDQNTEGGPLVNKQQVSSLDAQVTDAVSRGARVRAGGRPRGGSGAFYEPTVLDSVDLEMKVMREEVFGPVAPIYVASDEAEAIRVANDSEFGLGSSLWTRDLDRAKRIAREIQSGLVFVNAFTKSDPRMPFGGVKRSGIGRELSKYGLKEFVNVKSVSIYGISAESSNNEVHSSIVE